MIVLNRLFKLSKVTFKFDFFLEPNQSNVVSIRIVVILRMYSNAFNTKVLNWGSTVVVVPTVTIGILKVILS